MTRARNSDEDSPLSRRALMIVVTSERAEMKSPAENPKPTGMLVLKVATLVVWSRLMAYVRVGRSEDGEEDEVEVECDVTRLWWAAVVAELNRYR
jgi:hypothetical protein